MYAVAVQYACMYVRMYMLVIVCSDKLVYLS